MVVNFVEKYQNLVISIISNNTTLQKLQKLNICNGKLIKNEMFIKNN